VAIGIRTTGKGQPFHGLKSIAIRILNGWMEGSGRTARMYVSEESDRGVLPRIKENTFPVDTYPTPSGTARVPRVECADKHSACPLFIPDKSRMR